MDGDEVSRGVGRGFGVRHGALGGKGVHIVSCVVCLINDGLLGAVVFCRGEEMIS